MSESGTAGARVPGNALPVSRIRPAYQQVADQLRDAVVSGGLAPGERLPGEGDLSKLFGVSRATVRQALQALLGRGLVTADQDLAGGFFVSRIEAHQVSDYLETTLGLMSGPDGISMAEMLEAREILEVPAARLAAVRRSERHLLLLRQALEREVRDRGREIRFGKHQNFHKTIVSAAGNRLMSVITEPVFTVLESRFVRPDISEDLWPRVDEDHEEILLHIERGEGDLAADAMRRHLIRIRPLYREAG